MSKKLLLLSGMSIVGVIISHATAWGLIAMFLWTHRYLPVTTPNFDQVGTPSYYLLLVFRSIFNVALPAFLLISAVFLSYSAQRMRTSGIWAVLKPRLSNLLIPYCIWSIIVFGLDLAIGSQRTGWEYLKDFFFAGALGPFYYIPLLVYLTLLSPLLVVWAQRHWPSLLAASAALQLATMAIRYPAVLGLTVPWVEVVKIWTPDWLFVRWIFFFSLGIVLGLHGDRLQPWLQARSRLWLVLVVVGLALNILEAEWIYRSPAGEWYPIAWVSTASFTLYGTAFLLYYMSLREVRVPLAPLFYKLGTQSFGIYLLHFLLMTYTAKVIYHLLPWLLGQEWLFQPVLVLVGLGGSLLIMQLIIRTPARRYYRILFG